MFLKKFVALTVVFSLIFLYFPAAGFAQTDTAKGLTKHPVKFSTLPEEKIPAETVEKKKTSKWVWIGIGAGLLALGGAAAAAGGGGDDPPPPQGGLEVTW